MLGDAIQVAPVMPKSGHMANQHAQGLRGRGRRAADGRRRPTRRRSSPTPATAIVSDKDAIHVASVHAYDRTRRRCMVVPGSGGRVAGAQRRRRAPYAEAGRATSGPTCWLEALARGATTARMRRARLGRCQRQLRRQHDRPICLRCRARTP